MNKKRTQQRKRKNRRTKRKQSRQLKTQRFRGGGFTIETLENTIVGVINPTQNPEYINTMLEYLKKILENSDVDILDIFNNSVIYNFLLLHDVNLLHKYYTYLIELKYTDKTLEIHKRNIIITKLKELLTTNNDKIVPIFNDEVIHNFLLLHDIPLLKKYYESIKTEYIDIEIVKSTLLGYDENIFIFIYEKHPEFKDIFEKSVVDYTYDETKTTNYKTLIKQKHEYINGIHILKNKCELEQTLIPYIENWIGIENLFAAADFHKIILDQIENEDECITKKTDECNNECTPYFSKSKKINLCVRTDRLHKISETNRFIIGKNGQKYKVIHSKILEHSIQTDNETIYYWFIVLQNVQTTDIYIGINSGYINENTLFNSLVSEVILHIQTTYIYTSTTHKLILFGHSMGGNIFTKVLKHLNTLDNKFCEQNIILLTSGLATTYITSLNYYLGFNCLTMEVSMIDSSMYLIVDNMMFRTIKDLDDDLNIVKNKLYPMYVILKIDETYELYKFDSQEHFIDYIFKISSMFTKREVKNMVNITGNNILISKYHQDWPVYHLFIENILTLSGPKL